MKLRSKGSIFVSAILAFMVTLLSGPIEDAQSFPFFQAERRIVDRQLNQNYAWWLRAYVYLSEKSCTETREEFKRRGELEPPFCSPDRALQGLVALEKILYHRELPNGLPERPTPDFSRKLNSLDHKTQLSLLQLNSGPEDGVFSTYAEHTCRRCKIDQTCSGLDRETQSKVQNNPILSELKNEYQHDACVEAARLALSQRESLRSSQYPPAIYAFRFAHCQEDFPTCSGSIASSTGNDQTIHLSCLEGVRSKLHLEFRQRMISKGFNAAEKILNSCQDLPISQAELGFDQNGFLNPQFDLLTCFESQPTGISLERAGLIQLSKQDFHWDELSFARFSWEEGAVEAPRPPKNLMDWISQTPSPVIVTKYTQDLEVAERNGAQVDRSWGTSISEWDAKTKQALSSITELLLRDRFRYASRWVRKTNRERNGRAVENPLPVQETDSLAQYWAKKCIEEVAIQPKKTDPSDSDPKDE